MDLLYEISNLMKQKDVDGIAEFYSKYRDSLDIDAQGSLCKLSSFQTDEAAQSLVPSLSINIKKGQTAVPVRYVAYAHLTLCISFCMHFRGKYGMHACMLVAINMHIVKGACASPFSKIFMLSALLQLTELPFLGLVESTPTYWTYDFILSLR